MRYLLDTNAVSDLMREEPALLARVAVLVNDVALVVCPIIIGEIEFGIARLPHGRRKTLLTKKAEMVLASMP